jgi:hypothetical protein
MTLSCEALLLTSICPGAKQALFLARKESKLDVAVEFDTFAFDGSSDRKNTRGTGTVIISSWSACTSEGSATIVVSTD